MHGLQRAVIVMRCAVTCVIVRRRGLDRLPKQEAAPGAKERPDHEEQKVGLHASASRDQISPSNAPRIDQAISPTPSARAAKRPASSGGTGPT